MDSKDQNNQKKQNESKIFKGGHVGTYYIEIANEEQNLKIVFRTNEELNSKTAKDMCNINEDNLEDFKEITLIFDFQSLSQNLNIDNLSQLIKNLWNPIERLNKEKTDLKLSLIIRNCLIEEIKPIYIKNLKLKKLEISDELYSISNNLDTLFPDLEVNELILRKFKINSKLQLSNFCKFITRIDCKKLILDDIFIELIIKKSEDDQEYKDLDIYFTLIDSFIHFDNTLTTIDTLILRDCPLFAIIDNLFNKKTFDSNDYKYIDIDENSLINPSIITKFKIDNKKCDICFDLDSFRIKCEENMDENNKIEYDFIDYLTYFFNIFVSFTTEDQKIKIKEEDDGVGEVYRQYLRKLTFKNFDITKLEFITGDDMTYIEEKDWVLDNNERKKKNKWEKFENELEKYLENFEVQSLSNVRELIFDNCSNFFIKWIINFIKGQKNNNINEQDDFDLIKIKKCGKDYVNLEKILTMKIKKLILFDSPLIIGSKFPEKNETHLKVINNNLGNINSLTIKINALDHYGKDHNLDTYKTYEILVELIKNDNFNKNLTFEFNALANIMTYLAFKTYFEKQDFYNDPNDDDGVEFGEKNKDNKLKGVLDEKEIIKEIPKQLPKYIFFSSNKKRDQIYEDSFNLKAFNKESKITLKNVTIKKTTENFDNQNYLTIYKTSSENKDISKLSYNNKLKKIEYGSDGFYIDRDYKNFFSINNIGSVELINVTFSNYKDSNLQKFEREGILNLISNSDIEKESINNKMKFPKYTIDAKTLNTILYENFLFEDFGNMFRYYDYKVDDNPEGNAKPISQDNLGKISTMSEYFKKLKEIFETFMKIGDEMTIVVNNIKELKEIICTLILVRKLVKEPFINKKIEMMDRTNTKKTMKVDMPNKTEIVEEIKGYFLQEKNESNDMLYSGVNYYYTSPEEKQILENRSLTIEGFKFNIQIEDNKIFDI